MIVEERMKYFEFAEIYALNILYYGFPIKTAKQVYSN